MTVQKRLSQLSGFFKGKISGVWGLISRSALRDFKVVNNLAPDDQWDSATEQTLMADGSVRVSETFIGGWGRGSGATAGRRNQAERDCASTHVRPK